MISDIHGNLEALVRCLDDMERSGVDQIVNLGDAIGYGPQPEDDLGLFEKKASIISLAITSWPRSIGIFATNYHRRRPPGHTHLLMLIGYDDGHIDFDRLHQEIFRLNPGHRHIVNVGPVGQPRDGDPRAKYVIWDNRRNILEIRRVAYDIEKTTKSIQQRGLVCRDAQGQRLYDGA